MSAIETYLQYIASKVWARDVRTAIVNAIRQCYDDVHNPTLNTEALQAAIQAKIDAGQMAALTIGDRTITAAKLALGVIPTPDTTLSQPGVPADAKKTGDEITAINKSLGALESNVFSVDAKYALAELLKNVTSADKNSKQLYEILINAMGVDMLKENIFIYLPSQFGDLFIQNGSLVLTNVGNVTNNMGINHNADMGSKYRVIGSKNGELESQSYTSLQNGTHFDLYPIPVPADATSAWIGVFPSERYVTSRLMRWNELNESYEVAEEASQKTQGSHIKTFSSGDNLFLAVMIAYDSSGSAYNGSPEAVVVAFKRG